MSKESEDKKEAEIVDLLERKQESNPLLDELGNQSNIIHNMTEVDMMRTKTIFGMFIDGLQYLTIAAEGPESENSKSAKNLLAHYFNMLQRAEATLNVIRKERPPSVVLPLGVELKDYRKKDG